MSFKLLTKLIVLIASLSILVACSSEDISELSLGVSDNDISSNRDSLEDDTVEDIRYFNAATIFEDVDFHTTTLGLWPIEPYDERFDGIFWSIPHGYTYFDFTGGHADPFLVVFANDIDFVDDPDYLSSKDTKVYINTNGEWHHAWFFSGELVLRLVAPYMFWCHEYNEEAHALLVVGFTIGMNDQARLITFRNGQLEVLRLDHSNARPGWHQTWQEQEQDD